MKIDRNVWDKVGGIVEATFVNIVQSNKVPQDFDLDELKSICYLECGYLIGRYKPGAWAVTTYVYEYLEKRVVARAKKELEESERMNRMLEDEIAAQKRDDEEEVVHHKYVDVDFFDDYKSLAAFLEDKDLYEHVISIADENGLGDIARCLEEGLTQREMSIKLGCSRSAIEKKIAKLRKLCCNFDIL